MAPTRRGSEDREHDAGFTLLELTVTMLILALVLIVALRSFSTIFASQTRQTSMSSAQQQLSLAFIALDREVRYAQGITQPDSSGGSYYVEFEYLPPAGASQCAELQYSPTAGTLSQRTWSVPVNNAAPSPGAWNVLANSLTTAGQPFSLVNQVGSDTTDNFADMEQLQIGLGAAAGKGSGQGTATSTAIFTAINTTTNQATTVCTGVTPS